MSARDYAAFAALGGGTVERVHSAEHVLPRPAWLVHDAARARFAYAVGAGRTPHRVYYEVHGRGRRKVLLLMGLGGTHTAWEPQLRFFGLERGDAFSVCAVDNRGVGLSDTPGGRWTTSELASDALQLLLQLECSARPGEGEGWGGGVHVVGLSMGGMVAQELVCLAPERVASLTLISTHAGGLVGTMPPRHGLRPFLKCMSALGTAQSVDGGLELLFPRAFLDEPAEHAQVLRDEPGLAIPAVELSSNRLKHAYYMIRRARKYLESGNAPELRLDGVWRQLQAVLSHYVSWGRLRALRAYKVDVLVVSGAKDNLVGCWNSRMLAEVLCGRWLHFSDAGHGVNEQHAPAVNAAIADLIDAADERLRQTPQIAQLRKPLPPTTHPLTTFLGALLAAWIVLRLEPVRRYLSPRLARQLSLIAAAVLTRRAYGGMFAP
jgi:pimeloyl-ACP methyl ester carboxylesterase